MFLLFIFSPGLFAASWQQVTFSGKEVPLKTVLTAIENQANYVFFYDAALMKEAKPVTVNAKEVPAESLLKDCMKKQPFEYSVKDKTVFITHKNETTAPPLPPPFLATGHIVNDQGQTVPGATVKVKGSNGGTTTDANGNFSLRVSGADVILVISFIGYETQEMQVKEGATLQVTLKESNKNLGEVIIVGYGSQQKATLTGAVSSIKGSEVVTTKNESVINMLTGKLPGVRIVQNSAEPGSFSNQFDIRGFGSPLVIVDGVPRDNYARIDPNDIEDLTVLKDASAAVYGVRAANGVVLITTKKGKAGHLELTYDGTVGVQQLSGWPKLLNIYDWMTLVNEKSMHNVDGGVRPYTQADYDAYKNGERIPGDWGGAVLNNSALQMQHSLTATGGTDKTTYFMSLGYYSQDGFWKSGDLNYKKYNVRSNITTKISKTLTASLRISGINDIKNQPGPVDTWDLFRSLWRNPPNLPNYANNDPGHLYGLGDNGYNTIAVTNNDISGYKTFNNKWFQGSFDLTYDVPFIKGLKAKGLYSYDAYIADYKQFNKQYNLYTYTNNNYTTIPTNGPSRVNRAYTIQPNTLLQYSLDYNRGFGDHNISVLALYEEQTRKSDNFNAQRNLVLGNLDQLASGSSDGQIASQDPGGLYTMTNKGIVGRIHYDYKSKYLIDFSGRYDGSSKFPVGKQWGFFPSVSGGWRLSEEGFIKKNADLSFIDNLKLRGSYGLLGDDGASQYQFIQGYDYPAGGNGQNGIASGYVYNGVYTSALGFRNLPNANITWYKAKTLDLGLDADLWKGLLSVQFDWYQRNRTGLLANRLVSLPASLGATLPQENLNSDLARGVEFAVTHTNKIGQITYRVSANISYTKIKNLYVERGPSGNSYDNWRNNPNDRNNDIWWGLGSAGRFTSFNDIYGYPIYQGGGNRATLPGDYKYQDWNNDGVIDDMDTHPIANTYNGSTSGQTPTPNPGAINYGITIDLQYKGFDLNALFQGVADRYVAYTNSLLMPLDNNGNGLTQFLDRWHPADPLADPYDPNTVYIPGYYGVTGSSPDANSAFNVQNSSYMRLKTVTLGYSLSADLLKKIGIQKARIYVNGYNIFTFTGLKYMDPEHPSDNYGYTYPLNKSYNVGLSVTF